MISLIERLFNTLFHFPGFDLGIEHSSFFLKPMT